MNERESLLAAILNSEPPAAWAAMHAFAAHLESDGDSQAIGWRMLARLKLWPVQSYDGHTTADWGFIEQLEYTDSPNPPVVTPLPRGSTLEECLVQAAASLYHSARGDP